MARLNPGTASERSVYVGAALAALAVMFAGFAPSYYLKAFSGAPELSTLKHVHGVVMTTWFVLFFVQARLVATGRTAIHRQLGAAGIVVAMLMVALGTTLAITSARAGFSPARELSPLVFLAIPLGEMVAFSVLFTAAIALRARSPWHKRLMVLASLGMLAPAFARMLAAVGLGGPAIFGLVDLVMLACIGYDTVKNRRLHPAFGWGFAVVLLLQGGRIALSRSAAWDSFARWLIA